MMFRSILVTVTLSFVMLSLPFTTTAQQERTNSASPKRTPENKQEPEDDVIRVETDLVNTLFTAVDRDRQFV